jgi:hypothetical protein
MPDPFPGLTGRWLHAFEEDHDGVAVYRPADADFPRARGRDGIEFGGDGSFTDWLIGRGDAGEPVPGHWQVDPDGRLQVHTERGGEHVYEVVEVAPDRLELRPSPS